MVEMVSVFERMIWAMRAQALTPVAKLALILAADRADCDCRCSDLERLAADVNVTMERLDEALAELIDANAILIRKDGIELLVRGER